MVGIHKITKGAFRLMRCFIEKFSSSNLYEANTTKLQSMNFSYIMGIIITLWLWDGQSGTRKQTKLGKAYNLDTSHLKLKEIELKRKLLSEKLGSKDRHRVRFSEAMRCSIGEKRAKARSGNTSVTAPRCHDRLRTRPRPTVCGEVSRLVYTRRPVQANVAPITSHYDNQGTLQTTKKALIDL